MLESIVAGLETKMLFGLDKKINYKSMRKPPPKPKSQQSDDNKSKEPKWRYDAEGKKIRNNRNEDGSKKKYKRESKSKLFWDELDK